MCPPCVDQTGRSPECWFICAPEARQCHTLGESSRKQATLWSRFSYGDVFFQPQPCWDVWSLFAKPVISNDGLQPTKVKRNAAVSQVTSSPIETLSVELLEMIIEHLEPEKKDIMGLALSCTLLWEVVSQRIRSFNLKNAAPWANTPLIYMGSYSASVPKTIDENGYVDAIVGAKSVYGYNFVSRPFFWKHRRFPEPISTRDVAKQWIDAGMEHLEDAHIAESDWEVMVTELDCRELYPQDRDWVLRNLSKKEFVRSEMLTSLASTSNCADTRVPIRLEDVLLRYISWSSCPSRGTSIKTEGAWAGDRFDLVTLKAHELEAADGWKDIIVDAVTDILSLRNAYYPPPESPSTKAPPSLLQALAADIISFSHKCTRQTKPKGSYTKRRAIQKLVTNGLIELNEKFGRKQVPQVTIQPTDNRGESWVF